MYYICQRCSTQSYNFYWAIPIQATRCVKRALLCYVFKKYSSDTHDAIYSALSELL